jgi:hypothetical protein
MVDHMVETSRLRGRIDVQVGTGRRRHGSENTGMAAGVKPRSREAVRLFAQGFTRDDSPDALGYYSPC